MPVFFSGYVLANASIKPGFGGGFTVSRYPGGTGSYRMTIPAGTYVRFLIPSITPITGRTVARVVQILRDGLSRDYWIDIEIHDMGTNALVDGDFMFVAIERSGP